MDEAVRKLSRHRKVLENERARLNRLLTPAKPDDIRACLGKLVVHFPQTNMSDNALAVLFRDYISDLGHFPAHMIGEACTQYRRTPPPEGKPKFFPLVAELIRLTEVMWKPVDHKRRTLTRLIERMGGDAPVNTARATAADWASLSETLKRIPDPAKSNHLPDVHYPNREYFERQTVQPEPQTQTTDNP